MKDNEDINGDNNDVKSGAQHQEDINGDNNEDKVCLDNWCAWLLASSPFGPSKAGLARPS